MDALPTAVRHAGAALVGAACCAVLFHLTPARSQAAWVVSLLVPWGVAVTLRPLPSIPLRHTVAIALLLRLLLVGTPPLLSDDLYRYLFEGRALLAGHNPFVHPPRALASLDPALAAQVNHPHLPSLYPPVALAWFVLLASTGAGPWVVQLGGALVDTANVALLHRVRIQRRLPTWPAALYALHPLPVLESAHGAHLEPLGIAASLTVLLALPRHPYRAFAAMITGIGVKLLPALFLPTFVRVLGWRQTLVAGGLGALALLLLASPVLDAGPALLHTFHLYGAHWSFNGLLYPLLVPVLGWRTRPLLVLVGALVVLATIRTRDPARAWWWTAAAFLILSPTVHPWYVLWALVPSLVLGHRGVALAAVALQGSYLVLAGWDPVTGSWTVPPWLGPLTWSGAIAGWLYARRKLDSPTRP